MSRILCHFSCGAASAVATKLTLSNFKNQDVVIVYAETGSEDDDNKRFFTECENWFNQKIITLKSQYKDTWEVWDKKKYISGIKGAPCTRLLKIDCREAFQKPDDIHVFGYTADSNDIKRANAFREHYPNLIINTPLIEKGINKSGCLAMILNAGIDPPRTYAIGFPNANCIPCCKAQSPNYWSLVRKEYPLHFTRMTELSRRLGAKLATLHGERIFIDEVPLDQPVTEAIAPECDMLCHLSEHELRN
jgi:hypothetical protein